MGCGASSTAHVEGTMDPKKPIHEEKKREEMKVHEEKKVEVKKEEVKKEEVKKEEPKKEEVKKEEPKKEEVKKEEPKKEEVKKEEPKKEEPKKEEVKKVEGKKEEGKKEEPKKEEAKKEEPKKDDTASLHPHKHPLVRHERLEEADYPGGKFKCNNCTNTYSGAVYHCATCFYDSCPNCYSRLSVSASHPHKHPLQRHENMDNPDYPGGKYACNACGNGFSGAVYHCATCLYDSCPTCYVKMSGAVPSHPHKHPLRRYEKMDDPNYHNGQYSCNNCSNTFSAVVYHCDSCWYDSCPECFAKLSGADTKHPHAHPLQHLTKIVDPAYNDGQFTCNNCKEHHAGEVYHCPTCFYDNCAKCFTALSQSGSS